MGLLVNKKTVLIVPNGNLLGFKLSIDNNNLEIPLKSPLLRGIELWDVMTVLQDLLNQSE